MQKYDIQIAPGPESKREEFIFHLICDFFLLFGFEEAHLSWKTKVRHETPAIPFPYSSVSFRSLMRVVHSSTKRMNILTSYCRLFDVMQSCRRHLPHEHTKTKPRHWNICVRMSKYLIFPLFITFASGEFSASEILRIQKSRQENKSANPFAPVSWIRNSHCHANTFSAVDTLISCISSGCRRTENCNLPKLLAHHCGMGASWLLPQQRYGYFTRFLCKLLEVKSNYHFLLAMKRIKENIIMRRSRRQSVPAALHLRRSHLNCMSLSPIHIQWKRI